MLVCPETAHEARSVAADFDARMASDPGTGMSPALNAGLGLAEGQRWFAWLNDDDVLTEGSLAATSGALEREPAATAAFGGVEYVDPSGRRLAMSRVGRLAPWLCTFGPDFIPQPGSLMRMDAVRSVGGLDDSLRYAMDLDLFLRLRRRGPLVAVSATVAR